MTEESRQPGPTPQQIQDSVRRRFGETASRPDEESVFPVGPASALKLGYDSADLERLPLCATESFCGVGNPLGLAFPNPTDVVLDLGSGAGLDAFLAAGHLSGGGFVIGVDMTPAMVSKASTTSHQLGLQKVMFLNAALEALPLADQTVDLVISNGVLNLCPDKALVLREAFRVLRDGGKLQVADILLHEEVSEEFVASRGAWSD